jgi:hypothetical protein
MSAVTLSIPRHLHVHREIYRRVRADFPVLLRRLSIFGK